ncbi:MAG TPA: coniferyl aldehyde dehydrogenase [Telluria sp.]|nr:coniferyl aldehyde dehydrogenase [Telluria sp.]
MDTVATSALSEAFALQRAASRAQPFAAWATRSDRLRRLRELLRDNRGALAAAVSSDFGHRSRHETELLEITPLLDGIAHSLRHGAGWMRQRQRFPGPKYWPGKAVLVPQPLGVAGIVVPWNYPLALSLGPLTSAFVAGNRAMLKLSELTPRLAEAMGALVTAAFAADELQLFEGDAEFSHRFCLLPFDHLLFTGSTAVGHHVMHAASDNLTPVTLELGGKSPAIIGPGKLSARRFDRMVERLVIGKTVNAGQTCIAPDYVYVPRARVAQLIDAARRATTRFYPDLAATPDYTSIISAHHFARLQALLDDALARGATGWPLSPAASDPVARRFPPVILSDPAPGSRVLDEEIFGPLLPVLAYDELDEALAAIKAHARPLALYLFEHDRRTIAHVLQHTVSGGVSVNDTLVHFGCDALPFGGVGASGMGAYHGEAGFRTFSHVKPVFHQARFNALRWLHPPFGRLVETLLRMPR